MHLRKLIENIIKHISMGGKSQKSSITVLIEYINFIRSLKSHNNSNNYMNIATLKNKQSVEQNEMSRGDMSACFVKFKF